jgi:pimeloyl-ACP methyl ester carboxylesterase
MIFFASRGFRCIAHDRRRHGRSSQTWAANDMDTYADDLMDLTEKLDLKNAIHAGHSTGGGEVARYIGRHGAGHWNVKGPTFIALHELFDKVNEAVEDYVDDIAERAVQLGGVAEGTARMAAKRSALAE